MNETDIKVLFGKKLKQLRKQKNITQFTLGEYAEINQRQVALIEAGKSFPSLKTLVKFKDIFEIRFQDLFLFENLQDSSILKKDIENILQRADAEKIRTLYAIAKELV